MDEIAEFIKNPSTASGGPPPFSKGGLRDYGIVIATDYKERVKEILKEREVFKLITFTDRHKLLTAEFWKISKQSSSPTANFLTNAQKKLRRRASPTTKKNLNISRILMIFRKANTLFTAFTGSEFTAA